MSEVLIDVTWRGLEVGRQVRLHEVTGDHGRLDVALPMPVGSALKLRASDGLELPAIVTGVHEQSPSGGQTPGMVVAPALDGASQAWWSARAAESAAEPPSTATARADDEPAVMIVAPVDPTSRPTMVWSAVGGPLGVPVQATPTPAPGVAATRRAIPASTSPPVIHAPAVSVPAPVGPAPTPVALAPAVTAVEDLDAAHTAVMPALVVPDDVPEDTSRTAIMAAVDVEAIIADGVAHAADASSDVSQGNGGTADDSGVVDAPSVGDSAATLARKGGTARGKRRRGR